MPYPGNRRDAQVVAMLECRAQLCTCQVCLRCHGKCVAYLQLRDPHIPETSE